jgi:hypothetical protein
MIRRRHPGGGVTCCRGTGEVVCSYPRYQIVSPSIHHVLDFLNRNKLRVSYKDAAGFLKVPPPSLSTLLGPRRPETSWIVNEETGTPTGYSERECHPDLRSHDMIADEEDLRLRMKRDRSRRRSG